MPCAEFVAGVRGKAAFGKAKLFVHSHGGHIVLHNEGIANAKALFAEDNEQPLQKQGAYSAPLCALVNIDGILHSPTVCGAGIEGPAVGVSENFAVFFIDEPRIGFGYFFYALAKFLDGRYFVLEGIGCVLYIRRIDAEKLCGILRRCDADYPGQTLFFRKLSLLMKYWITVNGSMASSIISAAVPRGTSMKSLSNMSTPTANIAVHAATRQPLSTDSGRHEHSSVTRLEIPVKITHTVEISSSVMPRYLPNAMAKTTPQNMVIAPAAARLSTLLIKSFDTRLKFGSRASTTPGIPEATAPIRVR